MCVGTAGSIPRAAFYTPAAQVVEQRSPKPQVAGSSPAWSARLCMTGGRHAESSGASGRKSSRCSGNVLLSGKNRLRRCCLYYAKSPTNRQGFELQTFDLIEKCGTQSVRFFIGFRLVRVVRDIFQYIAGLAFQQSTDFV